MYCLRFSLKRNKFYAFVRLSGKSLRFQWQIRHRRRLLSESHKKSEQLNH